MRSIAFAFSIDSPTARASSGCPPFISMIARAPGCLANTSSSRGTPIPFPRKGGAVDLEMKTRVDRRELRRGEAANRARAVGRAIERLIVDDDGNARPRTAARRFRARLIRTTCRCRSPASCSRAPASRRRGGQTRAGDRIGRLAGPQTTQINPFASHQGHRRRRSRSSFGAS